MKFFTKGILVDKHKITLHQLSDTTMLITGTTLFSEDISIEPILSVEQAINRLKESNSNVTDESILSNKLVIYKALDSNPDLCYKIEVLLSELEHYYYYVSAKNGEIIKTSTLVYNYTPAIGTANLHNWGTQTIFTSYDNSINKYILFDQVANIQTYDIDAAVSIKYANNLSDLNNNWTIEEFPETETYSMNAALVSHWAARKTYDFFYTTFNRNGIDGNNKKTNIYVNYGGEIFGGNAKWSNTDEVIFIGSGVTSFSIHHFGVLDVIAHEFGHAVTYYSENDLEYSGESGAISEGISDIWGACVENYIGGQSDYAIWNHANQRGHSMRNMANPNAVDSPATKQPDTYKGIYWMNTANTQNDHGGVHTNSGVVNYWFYLLTKGGCGINDNQEPYEVDGVGFSISQRIVYETITCYLMENSTFNQFRTSTLNAAADLYGGTSSNIYKQVMNAWHAVGVGRPYMASNIIGDFGICDGGVYSIDAHPAVSISWSVDKFNDINSQKDKLTIVSGQGTNTIVVNRGTRSFANVNGIPEKYKGNVKLAATLTYGSNVVTKYKNLFSNDAISEIKYTVTPSSNLSLLDEYKFYVESVASTHLNWEVKSGNNVYTATAQNYIIVKLPKILMQDVFISVNDSGGCSSTNYETMTLHRMVMQTPMFSHENPVSSNSVFYLRKELDELNIDAIYKIEIWNEYGLISSEIYNDASEFMISTEGLTPGIYFIQIYKDNEFLNTQKVIIE